LRTSPAYEAGKNGTQRSESRELLRLLEEARFGIACRNHDPGEVLGGLEGQAALHVLTSGTALQVRSAKRAGKPRSVC
jgi:hypothetical protein